MGMTLVHHQFFLVGLLLVRGHWYWFYVIIGMRVWRRGLHLPCSWQHGHDAGAPPVLVVRFVIKLLGVRRGFGSVSSAT
jgi:hypothetical protein